MSKAFERARKPAYTGQSRCWPCTVVNVSLLAIGLLGMWVVAPSWLVAAAGVVGLAAIWLRGYLVPYTPRFAPRLVSLLPHDPFHATHGGAGQTGSTSSVLLGPKDEDIDGEQLLSELVTAGVIHSDDDEQLLLDETVRAEWDAEMDAYRELDLDALAEAVESRVPGGTVEAVRAGDDEWLDVSTDPASETAEHALEIPVAIADLAAAAVLKERIEDRSVRAQAVERLRLFLADCPRCGTELVETDTMDCCGGMIDPTATPDPVRACPSCDARLYTYDTTD